MPLSSLALLHLRFFFAFAVKTFLARKRVNYQGYCSNHYYPLRICRIPGKQRNQRNNKPDNKLTPTFTHMSPPTIKEIKNI